MQTLCYWARVCGKAIARHSQTLGVVLVLSFSSLAQIQNGQFTGVVTDPSGAVVPGAAITVRNLDTGLALTTIGNDSGLYTAREVPVGKYKITAGARGFKTVIK